MNKTIWKFPLELTFRQSIVMPVGAEILTVQIQNEIPCLWALVNPDEVVEFRHIEIFATGTRFYDIIVPRKYISTFQMGKGQLVYHAFYLVH